MNMSFLNDEIAILAYRGHSLSRTEVSRRGSFWESPHRSGTPMTSPTLHILIAEDQIFIALEAERIFRELLDCEVTICRREQIATAVTNANFDLVVLEFVGKPEQDRAYFALASAAADDVVLLFAGGDLRRQAAELFAAPGLEKPFDEPMVRAFVAGYLAGRRTRSVSE